MRLLKAHGQNFQSYQVVEFDYAEQGLALVSGHMKAGKSTLLDLPSWVLYGITSKESAADDVRSWFADGELTTGSAMVQLADGSCLAVTRIRGKRSAQNDLYFYQYRTAEHGPAEPTRGKDATDTQRMIADLLGVSAELFLAAGYMTQFSDADRFFLSKAKDRRETLERIADQSFAIKLAEQTSEARKGAKKRREEAEIVRARLDGRLDSTRAMIQNHTSRASQWEQQQDSLIGQLKNTIQGWENDQRARLVHVHDLTVKWEDDRVTRVAEAIAAVDEWEDARSTRVAFAKAQEQSWGSERGARAQKIADQLGLLEKTIQPAEEFLAREGQLKTQIKAAETAAQTLLVKSRDLSTVKAQLINLKKEYTTLSSLEGTCPTCLGPADNEHGQARRDEIEVELAGILDTQDALQAEVTELETTSSLRTKLYKDLETVRRQVSENQALVTRAQTLRDQVAVIRGETNPHAEKVAMILAEANPRTSAVEAARVAENPHAPALEAARNAVNPHTVSLERAKLEKNPYLETVKSQETALAGLEKDLAQALAALDQCDREISSLTWLYEKSFVLRGKILEGAVRSIETRTNEILERYFDAELRLSLTLPDSDKLEVEIRNGGYTCPFKQLSGGERTLLCRAFSFAYMRAAQDAAGIRIDVLMLDEVLNGLDATMKIKAFAMLQAMAEDYSTILVIDHHDEFKQLFPKQFLVTMTGVHSSVEEIEAT